MISTHRFNFDERGEVARKLFENANSLQITLTRGGSVCEKLLYFELHGGFMESEGDLPAIAAELVEAFNKLPRPVAKDDSDDDWKGDE